MDRSTDNSHDEPEDQEIDSPEKLCALLKRTLDFAFEISLLDEDDPKVQQFEEQIVELKEKIDRYYSANFDSYTIREREIFVQFLRLPVSKTSYFILRGIELLGAIEFRLKVSYFIDKDHREFYRMMLPYLVTLIDEFLNDDAPQIHKFINIGEFSSAIMASEFYELGKTYYEQQVLDLHEAFRRILHEIVDYRENLANRAVPVMIQFKHLLQLVLKQLNTPPVSN